MAYTIAFKPIPQSDPSALEFLDEGTLGGETLTSRVITIVKSDLSSVDYPFPDNVVTNIILAGILDKDYALEATLTVVTNVATYTLTYRFVTLGYAQLAKKNRIKRLSVDTTIEDREQYRKNTLLINYDMLVANDRVLFSDIIGAQKALDNIADVIAKDANSPFSY